MICLLYTSDAADEFTFIEKALKEKVIFDGRNIYNPEQMREFGYTYYGIGKNR